MRKEVWFGLTIMAAVVIGVFAFMPSPAQMTNGHLGLLMLALIVVAIMLGFPTAFTLMGMGVIFSWFAYRSQNPELAVTQTLDLMVQRAYAVMSNDVLISIPLFVFMGYLVERANLIEKLFRSLHLALARIPGSLAVATLVTCAVFATATGIVGAVVTLMGLLAMPPMLRAGYNIRLVAGVITAGGCLGILIPPSVMLIVYGATAGVSVVQLYAGAFFPGLMLAGLYIGYVIIVAKLRPDLAPPLPQNERHVSLPPHAQRIADTISTHAIPGLFAGMRRLTGGDQVRARRDILLIASPALLFLLVMGLTWHSLTKPDVVADVAGLEQVGIGAAEPAAETSTEASGAGQLAEPPQEGRLAEPGQLAEPPADGRLPEPGQLAEPEADGKLPEPGQLAEARGDGRLPEPGQAEQAAVAEGPAASPVASAPPAGEATTSGAATATAAASAGTGAWERLPAPNGFWITLAAGIAVLAALYWSFTLERVEIFRQLVSSFFPLAVMILAVLGTIVFGLATPTEAAAIGSLGGFALAAVYGLVALPPERRRTVALAWIPLLLLVGVSIAWFILYKAEVLDAGPPMVIGWVSIAAALLWVATATWQAHLGQTVRESAFLTAKTSAMVCWLFVGSSIFSAAFALLGGQEIVERWVLSLGLTPIQFMILAQIIIFLLGWPLEWTEIIVIFMPIFVPLLIKFQIDPLFFGLLVALNLQTAFLSPPVAMAAFYLKGVAPPHVTLNQIFLGMLPFMAIQVVALALLYVFPGIGLWLPQLLYR